MSGINKNFKNRSSAISSTGVPTKIFGKNVTPDVVNYSWIGSIDENFYTPITLWTSSANPVLAIGVILYYENELINVYDQPTFYYEQQRFNIAAGAITSIDKLNENSN